MKAKVTMLRSGAAYEDKQRRVRIEFKDATYGYREVEFPEGVLELAHVELDMELEVEVELAVGGAIDPELQRFRDIQDAELRRGR